jgi:hypothetical protein
MPTATFRVRTLTFLCGLPLFAAPLFAQSPAQPAIDVARLQTEVANLREEVAALRSAVEAMRGGAPLRALAQAAAPAPVVTQDAIDVLKAQVEEQAQVKVESASRMPVKVSGTILTNTYVNTGEANWLENPNLVGAPSSEHGSRGSMSATARQSRLGLDVGGIALGNWQASGTIIADFFGGVPGFQTGTVMGLPRLLYAFGRVETDRTAIEIGQDHAILAPRDPTSLAALSFPLLFRSGNLYLRAPQARVEQKLTQDVTLTAGIVAPIAGDAGAAYDFAPPAGAGERSMRPAFESRVAFSRGTSDSHSEFTAGVSGHYGWRRNIAAASTSDTWAAALDVNVRVGRLGAAGEIFSADNAEAFGGGLSQPGRAAGGWAEVRFTLTPKTTLAGGFGRDKPDDAVGRLVRVENRSVFGNAIVQITPEVAASLEYRWLETQLGPAPVARRNHHVDAVFAVKF